MAAATLTSSIAAHLAPGHTCGGCDVDPRIRNVLIRGCMSILNRRIDNIRTTHRGGDEATALAALDEIEQAVRAARQAITGKE
jgi:uncharacterized protein (UPF0305 family)